MPKSCFASWLGSVLGALSISVWISWKFRWWMEQHRCTEFFVNFLTGISILFDFLTEISGDFGSLIRFLELTVFGISRHFQGNICIICLRFQIFGNLGSMESAFVQNTCKTYCITQCFPPLKPLHRYSSRFR